MLWILFRDDLVEFAAPELDEKAALKDKSGAIFGVVCLSTCLVMLSLSTWLQLSMWIITSLAALAMLLKDVWNDCHSNREETLLLRKVYERMPWKIVPFVIGMFTLVGALTEAGWVDRLATFLSQISSSLFVTVLLMGTLSTLMCNLMNNQPMTILFTQVLLSPDFDQSERNQFGAMFALIIGSNLGANFTMIGALAGIMWNRIIAQHNISIGFFQFAKYGLFVMPPVVLVACVVLFSQIKLLK